MIEYVLEFHDWQAFKPDKESDLVASFLFTLRPVAGSTPGGKGQPRHAFWTEVKLARELTSGGRWPSLSKREKIVAMFQFARERIIEAGHDLREAPMEWRPGGPLLDGPQWDLRQIDFPKAAPLVFAVPAEHGESKLQARKAAGLPRG